MTVTVTLPWPPSKTSKNASRQGDWRGKARAAKDYRAACAWQCVVLDVKRRKWPSGDIPVRVTYHPPTRHRVDWDNLAGRAKQGFDAVAEVVGLDDSRWWPVLSCKGEVVPGGRIVIQIGTAEAP